MVCCDPCMCSMPGKHWLCITMVIVDGELQRQSDIRVSELYFRLHCSHTKKPFDLSRWPFQVPAGTSVPSWMFIDILQSDGFNVTAAELLAADGQPDTTLVPPTQLSPTPLSTSTSSTPFEIPTISIEFTRTTLINITPTQPLGNLDPTTQHFATEHPETQPTFKPALASAEHSRHKGHAKAIAGAVVGSLFLVVGAAIAYVRWEVGRIGTRYPERSSSEVTLTGGEAALFGPERDVPSSWTPSPYEHVGWNPMPFREAEHPSMPVGDAGITSMPVPSTEYRLAGV